MKHFISSKTKYGVPLFFGPAFFCEGRKEEAHNTENNEENQKRLPL